MAFENTPGREPVQIVEIVQPFCGNTFGVAPCTASAAPNAKCYNTRATCQDAPNFNPSTMSLFFSRGNVADRGVAGADYIIPSLVSVSTTPTKINLAGASPDASGIGNRAVCNITFKDHPHTDRIVDPYLSGRTFDPMLRGSFWTKWIVRNKYRQNIVINVYEGYAGQSLAAMVKRTYFMQSIQGPDASGRISIQGKDILAKLEERKSQAPAASPGRLFAAVAIGDMTFEAQNAVATDYAASGWVRIGEEIIRYSARSNSANGVTFTVQTRATDNTIAADHAVDDTVQQCLRFVNEPIDQALTALLGTYGGIDAAYRDTANWATEVGTYLASYRLNGLVTVPTAVVDLVSDIQRQCLCYIWWDERAAKVKLRAVRGIDADPPILTAEYHILADSFALAEKPAERASQVWIYYGMQNFIISPKDPKAYASASVVSNIESETAEQYGEPSIRTIYAQFLASGNLADNTASKISLRYVDIPSTCTFSLDAKDRAIWVGDIVKISHHLDVDQFGARRVRNWTIVSAHETLPGEVVQYVAEDTTLYGTVNYVMAAAEPDYPGAGLTPFKNGYIGNSAGKLSDGSNCARIS